MARGSSEYVMVRNSMNLDSIAKLTHIYPLELQYASQLGGSDLTGAADAIDEGLWRMSEFDQDSCRASSVFLPVGTWVRSKPFLRMSAFVVTFSSSSQLPI